MKRSYIYLLLTLVFFVSCSEEKSQEKQTEKKVKKVPKVVKHTVDPASEHFSVEDILKIDKEIPLIELIVPKNWGQQELDQLKQLELLSEATFKGNDLSKIEIDFLTYKRTVKILRFKDCTIHNDLFKILRRTVVEKIVFQNTALTDEVIQSLTHAPRLKEVYTDSKLEELKTALPKVEIKSL
ncbi:MAG: hypothetical protein MK132_23655 [Lentisphaerales bacterium]|nr:hypothetical protein [Lentisphaerales bacterium]